MRKYILPVKGNYTSMETKEREDSFEMNRGYGWEEEYRVYRTNWIEFPRRRYVAEYPLNVDIELSTVCNLHCPMCYTITEAFQKEVCRKFMDRDLFFKIIDEIEGKVPAVRLSLRGECTIHPNFVEFILYCKNKGIREVSFLTNGSTLSEDFFKEIAMAGADWITISIDGLYDTYEKIRKPLKFEDTLQKLKDIYRVKKEMKLKRPVIKIQSIWPAIRHQEEKYYNLFAPYVDLIAFNPLIDFSKQKEGKSYEENFVCPQLYQRLIIGADGMAMCCANDENGHCIIGNANKETVYHIWHGEKRMKIIKLHEAGRFQELAICRTCHISAKTEANEFGMVNGRKFPILNYVTRE